MNPVLLQMQPRQLDECIESIYQNVNIPKVWFRAFDEPSVCAAMNEFVATTSYSHYIINSDDVIVYKDAFDCVMNHAEKYKVFTGWVNMHMIGDKMSDISNVTKGRLTLRGQFPVREDYPPWHTIEKVRQLIGPQETSYASFAISCFAREVLTKYLLQTYSNGNSSDHHLAYRMQKDGNYKVYTDRDAFCLHLRQGWGPYKKKWLVGNRKPEIVYEL